MSKRLLSTLIAMSCAGIAGNASAAGFAIAENSVTGLGGAFAGGAAIASDASTVWYNPAGMSRLKGAQIHAGMHYIAPTFDFKNTGSVQTLGGTTTGALLPTALQNDGGGKAAVVPNFYYTRKLTDVVNVGLGINVPFGLATEYDEDWVGRYHTIDSEIHTMNFNPALSWQVHDRVSVGAGLNIQYMKARLTNAVDFSAVCFSAQSTGVARALAAGAITPAAAAAATTPAALTATCGGFPGTGAQDGRTRNKGDDISVGFNVGMLIEPTDHTRVGVAYRSRVKHRLDGNARTNMPTSITALAGAPATAALGGGILATFADGGMKATAELPDMASFSIYHDVNEKWAVMADATWTGWSSVPELRLEFDNPLRSDGVEDLQWNDTWRFSAAVNFRPTKRIVLRLGGAFDQAPVPNEEMLTPRLPDNDRIWLSAGAGYRVNDHIQVDVGYTHLFVDTTRVNRTAATGAVLTGEYESEANLFSGSVNYTF